MIGSVRGGWDLSIYLVTDTPLAASAGHARLGELVASAVAGGVTAVQLREKEATSVRRVELLRQIADVLPSQVALIVNDDVEAFVAARSEGIAVTGVHVGQDDASPDEVRAAIGADALLGLSAATGEELSAVDARVVDYVGIGALHGTPTKTDAPPALGRDGMRERAQMSLVPAVAIGGVTVDDAYALADSALAGIAVVSGICAQPDPEQAARAYAQAWRRVAA